jgi:hypothetical protein
MVPPPQAALPGIAADRFNHKHREGVLDLASFDPDACIKQNKRVKMKFMSDGEDIDFEIKESLESNSPILKGKGYHGKSVIDSLVGSTSSGTGSLNEGEFNMVEVNGIFTG